LVHGLDFERTIKMMGGGLAVAVLFDAPTVPMLLVRHHGTPGDPNCWLPDSLDGHLPNLDDEG